MTSTLGATPPPASPTPHCAPGQAQLIIRPYSGKNDPRFPATRLLRRIVSFLLDVVLHSLCATAAAVVAGQPVGLSLAWGIGYIGASLTNRVLLQSVCHATLGKILTGLQVIRRHDCGWPSVSSLTLHWIGAIVAMALDELDDDNSWIATVRRSDIVRMHRANTVVRPAPRSPEPAPGSQWHRPVRHGRRLVWDLEIVWAPQRPGNPSDDTVIQAMLIDWLLHAGIGAVAAITLYLYTDILELAWLGIPAWLAASLFHRIALRRILGKTLGQAIFGIRLAYPDGRKPGLIALPIVWVGGLIYLFFV